MTWVKLCGMTRRADVEAAAEAGADAVGFVLHRASPRFVEPSAVAGLADAAEVATFLVTVDAEPSWLVTAATDLGVDGVQPHGDRAGEAAVAALEAGLDVLVPIRMADAVPDLSGIPVDARPLLDSHVVGAHGGSGRSFDWSLAAAIDREFVLAGGLRPGNVAEAIRVARPWGVDVASGVESAPGVKDHAAMRCFVEEART